MPTRPRTAAPANPALPRALDLRNPRPLEPREVVWMLVEDDLRLKAGAAALWAVALAAIAVATFWHEALLPASVAGIVSLSVSYALIREVIRRRSSAPQFHEAIWGGLHRMGVRHPFRYAVEHPEAVRVFDEVEECLNSWHRRTEFDWSNRHHRWLSADERSALAMLAFTVEEPSAALRIPSLVAERGTSDPLAIHALLTMVAPSSAAALGDGAL